MYLLDKKCCRFIWCRWIYKDVSWHTTHVPCVELRVKNRGEALLKNSEQLELDQARGMIQSCWPFQDPQILKRHAEILLYLADPEFEP